MTKKSTKKITSAILALVLAAGMSVSAFAVHTAPDGEDCWGTSYSIEHSAHMGVTTQKHISIIDDKECTITSLTMMHTKRCAVCGVILSRYSKTCRVVHNVCPVDYNNCEEYQSLRVEWYDVK